MIKRMSVCLLLAGVAVWGLPGCSPKMTIEEMKADMPKRPVELDKLAMFEGDWEYDGQANFAGLEQALEMKGTDQHWCVDPQAGKWEIPQLVVRQLRWHRQGDEHLRRGYPNVEIQGQGLFELGHLYHSR